MNNKDFQHLLFNENGCVIDGRGHYFKSVNSMLKAYNTNDTVFFSRLNRGKSVSEALLRDGKYPEKISNTAIKVLGKYFGTYKHVAKHFNLCRSSVMSNRENLDEYIKSRLKYSYDKSRCMTLTDASTECDVSTGLLSYRVRTGSTIEEAMTRPVNHSHGPCIPTTDHHGVTYPSKTAMCVAYNMSPQTYEHRIKKGWTKEKALTTPVQ